GGDDRKGRTGWGAKGVDIDFAVTSPPVRSDIWGDVMRKRCGRGRLGAAMLIAALAGADVQAASCWRADQPQTVEGRLSIGKFVDAADRPEPAFILTPPAPACLPDAVLGDL